MLYNADDTQISSARAQPVPRMRTASARTDERGKRLGDLHCLLDLANFLTGERAMAEFFGRRMPLSDDSERFNSGAKYATGDRCPTCKWEPNDLARYFPGNVVEQVVER